ncbi:MAG: histidine phosphatase family protein [Sarcina sp.]
MRKIFLVRHGETEWNKLDKMQGWADSPLSELGEMQAKWLSEKINDFNINKIYTSPSGRAIRTSNLIKGDNNIEIVVSENLKEMNMGVWEGLEKKVIENLYSEDYYNFWNTPEKYIPKENGESFLEVRERVFQEIMKIVKENDNKNILIVSHGLSIKSFLSELENKKIEELWSEPIVNQTSVTEIDFYEDRYEIIRKGDISHYKYSYDI